MLIINYICLENKKFSVDPREKKFFSEQNNATRKQKIIYLEENLKLHGHFNISSDLSPQFPQLYSKCSVV